MEVRVRVRVRTAMVGLGLGESSKAYELLTMETGFNGGYC
jgi:hypothetical protein